MGAEFKRTLARQLWHLRVPKDKPVRVWVIDEHRYGLISHQRQCWGLRRVRPHAPYRTRYQWGYVATALEVEGSEEGLCVFLPVVSHEASACFLREISLMDPSSVHVIIQDQAGFHFKDGAAALPPNMRIINLPPYSPELNPVEHVGSLLRAATGNTVFATLDKMEARIEDELRPLWTESARVRALIGNGWLRTQVNAISD